MEIRSGIEGLSSLLGVNAPSSAATEAKTGSAAAGTINGPINGLMTGPLGADRATVSSAASEMAQSAGEDGVRMEKVASVQAALADGSYSVPASAVASKLVDAMLGG